MEEEIRNGEQERERLRIESQRLRDELSDLRVEAEVRDGKLRNAEAAADKHRSRNPSALDSTAARPPSRVSQHSPTTSTSSPTIATPPTKSASSTVSETPTPPSPPTSDHSVPAATTIDTRSIPKSQFSLADSSITPRPSSIAARPASRLSVSRNSLLPSASRRSTIYRTEDTPKGPGLPSSGSLHQIRGLIGKMQKLEQRVNSARSKLPAPTTTPPRASTRSNSALGQAYIPPTITMRSNRKRTGGSNASSALQQFSRADDGASRDGSGVGSRPSSRHSITSRTSFSHLPGAAATSSSRPASRQSMSGSRTPLGHYSTSTMSESRRPRSSVGGSYATTHGGHGQPVSVNRLNHHGSQSFDDGEQEEVLTPTPARRGTFGKGDQGSGIPSFPTSNAKRRISGLGSGRRLSSGTGTKPREEGDMGPPERKPVRKLSGVGETF